jgi:hypothetical protein
VRDVFNVAPPGARDDRRIAGAPSTQPFGRREDDNPYRTEVNGQKSRPTCDQLRYLAERVEEAGRRDLAGSGKSVEERAAWA